ncbi:MAG TPA: M12 family metallo-peptidase, partial [Pyrinomonadaceae bacterium]|nr:M12 family metallo-peptidase [Pyrinomonadaceae bacterium]
MKRETSNFHIGGTRVFRFGLLAGVFGLIVAASGIAPVIKSASSAKSNIQSNAVTYLKFSLQETSDNPWSFEQENSAKSQSPQASLRAFRRVALNSAALVSILRSAPLEFSRDAQERRSVLSLPIADGTFLRFSMVDSPIMAPELAARYPEIKTYAAQGIDDPTATARFDWMPTGFHGIVLSSKGAVLIEPATLGDVENYIVYFQKDVVVGSGECDVTTEEQQAAIARNSYLKQAASVPPKVASGMTLRTYRLAAAATAEYTQAYGGGSVSGGLAAVTTTINLVDAIYEREVAIRLTLIANNDAIIFTDTTTDGYTSDNVNLLIGENQTKIDAVIGSANYDIGHVFDGRLLSGGAFSWQGLGSFAVVCLNGSKARGVDIFRSVQPTNLYAYYSAAHEIGHQFNATHTFNTTAGSCGSQRWPPTAYEPYNGSTIMAYRLACSPEDLASTDTYFHNASIEQIVNFSTAAGGNGCAAQTGTGNNPPNVNAGPTYTIPMGTPFTLTATGSDPDGDAITFGWEEFDAGTAAPPNTDDGSRAIFRSFAPTTSPSRTFPRLQDILSGFATAGESLPTTTRTMNFRVTARDNRSGGGGVNSAATQVNIRSDAGSFTVTNPASGANWSTGSSQNVLWNVSNTNIAPVGCASVRITLSTDGGSTFPIVLADNTPNDGSESVTIPGAPTA